MDMDSLFVSDVDHCLLFDIDLPFAKKWSVSARAWEQLVAPTLSKDSLMERMSFGKTPAKTLEADVKPMQMAMTNGSVRFIGKVSV